MDLYAKNANKFSRIFPFLQSILRLAFQPKRIISRKFEGRRGKASEKSAGVETYSEASIEARNKAHNIEEILRGRRGKPSERSAGVVTYVKRLESMV
jgi:hypothetical protein